MHFGIYCTFYNIIVTVLLFEFYDISYSVEISKKKFIKKF